MPSLTSVATPDDARAIARRGRYSAREVLWSESSLKRVRYCGKYATGDNVTVKRSPDGSSSGFGGVQSCGSVWACPVCSEKINAERQSDLSAGIAAWLDQGHAVVFGTLTLSHSRADRLSDLWDAISPAWNRTTSGAGVAWNGSKGKPGRPSFQHGDKATFGIRGYVRVIEVKHGHDNGWHPHVHFLLFLDQALTPGQSMDLSNRMFARWETALASKGYTTSRAHGIDLRPVRDADMADYFTKGTYTSPGAAAYEVTGSHSKQAGKGGRTPFQILGDVVTVGDEADLHRWWEYESASKGRRQLTWSHGLRDLLALGVERSDEEIVEEEVEDAQVVAVISGSDYTRLARGGWLTDVLEVAENGETRDARQALRGFLIGLGCIPIEQLTT